MDYMSAYYVPVAQLLALPTGGTLRNSLDQLRCYKLACNLEMALTLTSAAWKFRVGLFVLWIAKELSFQVTYEAAAGSELSPLCTLMQDSLQLLASI